MKDDQSSFTFEAAAERAEVGIQRAIDSAQREEPGWPERALEEFREYARRHDRLLTEDVRHWAELRGFPKPPEPRAWGGVAQAARRAGYVKNIGFAPAKDSNLSPKVLWGSLIYTGSYNA